MSDLTPEEIHRVRMARAELVAKVTAAHSEMEAQKFAVREANRRLAESERDMDFWEREVANFDERYAPDLYRTK